MLTFLCNSKRIEKNSMNGPFLATFEHFWWKNENYGKNEAKPQQVKYEVIQYSKSSNSAVFKQCEFTITWFTFCSQNIRSYKENSAIPCNSSNFDPHPNIDSNSAVLNSTIYFLDKNTCYSGTYCIMFIISSSLLCKQIGSSTST